MRVELRLMGRNCKEVISVQNKEELYSSPSNRNMDPPTHGDGRPDECWSGKNIVHGSQTVDVGLD